MRTNEERDAGLLNEFLCAESQCYSKPPRAGPVQQLKILGINVDVWSPQSLKDWRERERGKRNVRTRSGRHEKTVNQERKFAPIGKRMDQLVMILNGALRGLRLTAIFRITSILQRSTRAVAIQPGRARHDTQPTWQVGPRILTLSSDRSVIALPVLLQDTRSVHAHSQTQAVFHGVVKQRIGGARCRGLLVELG